MAQRDRADAASAATAMNLHRSAKAHREEFEACPYCGSTEFQSGPRGYCRNVECTRCGARFNLFLFRDYPVMLINILAGPRAPEAPGKPH